MTARELVDLLEARSTSASSKRNREGDYHVTCPAHADPNPSLHVTDRADKVLLRCQAGCETQAVLDAAGLDWSALFHDSSNGRREIVATYDYTDPDGRLVFQAVRLWPKGFYQRQPNGAGDWTNNIQGCTRWLYRLPRVMEAVERGEPIFVCEGEKDVDALERLGLYATTNPMGAGKWRDEHSRMLTGASDVNVVRDHDDKGREHAAEVVASLRRIGIEPTLLEPREGNDVSDHLTAGHSWMAMVEVEAPAEPVEPEQAKRPAILDLLVDMEAASVGADEPLPYVIEPLAVRGYLTVLVGKRSAFKSFLMTVLAYRCHHGLGEIAGLGCAPATALYVDAENGPKLLARRFKAAGIPVDGFLVADGSRIELTKGTRNLRDLIKATGARLVILDALRRLTPGLDEDSSKDMAPLIGSLGDLARELDVAIVLLHHQSSKPGAPPSRGSSAIEDQADAVFRLRCHRGNRLKLWVGEGGKFRMDAEPAPFWLDFAWHEGVFALGACEPASTDDDDDDVPSAEDRVIERIRELAHRVAADGGWLPKRLAQTVGYDPDDGTFTRARDRLYALKEWEAIGDGPGRRMRPLGSGQMEMDDDG
jgi:5S rRNA maturation endonuclease (ribonuclease M5)